MDKAIHFFGTLRMPLYPWFLLLSPHTWISGQEPKLASMSSHYRRMFCEWLSTYLPDEQMYTGLKEYCSSRIRVHSSSNYSTCSVHWSCLPRNLARLGTSNFFSRHHARLFHSFHEQHCCNDHGTTQKDRGEGEARTESNSG
jgi:hypothetical protein